MVRFQIQIFFSSLILVFSWPGVFSNARNFVRHFDENNWEQVLKGEWMIKFYAPWCPACKGLEKTWQDYAELASEVGVSVGEVDITTSPGLGGRFMVTALPTIFHVLNGEFRQYKGSRNQESLMAFVEDKKWQQVDAISFWKSPKSFHMGIVASFFKLSQTLRQLHNKFMDDFGLPSWGSYVIFAIATILVGAILGLIFVCVIDFIYPPKPHFEAKRSEYSSEVDDELGDEDIRDDLLDDISNRDSDSDKGINDNIKKRKSRKAD